MFKRAIRFNYYYKYRLQRGAASDDEIKKVFFNTLKNVLKLEQQINTHTRILVNAVPMDPQWFLMVPQIHIRNKWAKFVLLKKKDAYHIWLDDMGLF